MQPHVGVTRLVEWTPTREISAVEFAPSAGDQLGVVVKVAFEEQDRIGRRMHGSGTEFARLTDPVWISEWAGASHLDGAGRDDRVKQVTFDLDPSHGPITACRFGVPAPVPRSRSVCLRSRILRGAAAR
jgi:hypothetical protein